MAFRPFRFGVQASWIYDRAGWIALARQVEALGYSTLTLPDHFSEQLAPVPALMCAADATESLRVGAQVWDNDYRHPAVLAKELATIDVLSDGRLEVGIGAGWQRADYDHTGISYDPAPVRIKRLVEAVRVIKALFAEGPVNLSGTHYTIRDYEGFPKPVQQFPPMLIGGGGRRVLMFAAREATIVGINGTLRAGVVGPDAIESMTPGAVDQKVGWVRDAAAGRPIELNVRAFYLRITRHRARVANELASMLGFTVQDVLGTPFALIGSTAELVEDLVARRERWGFSYVSVGAEDVEAFAPVVAALAGR